MYRHGEGCSEDKKKAMELFKECGDVENAIFNLGKNSLFVYLTKQLNNIYR